MSQRDFFDRLKPGMIQDLGSHIFEEDEIIAFAREFDPQRFHLDADAARESNFGGLCASGWHTLSVWMRLNIDNGRTELGKLTGYQGPDPVFGPSPGVRNIKWLLPVFVGDEIRYFSEVTGKRTNPRRPGWALITSHSWGENQNGKRVVEMDGAVTIPID